MIKKISILIIVIMITTCNTGYCGLLFQGGKTIEGRVVDKDTGDPVEGACVVVQWSKRILAGWDGKLLEIKEAVTDKNGYFKISRWSKVSLSIVGTNYPSLIVFKPGYEMKRISRFEYKKNVTGVIDSEKYKDEKAIYEEGVFRFKKHSGTLEEKMNAVYWTQSMMPDDLTDIKKYHLDIKIPRMLKILELENQEIDKELKRNKTGKKINIYKD